MRIKYPIPEDTLEGFAGRHHLVMYVGHRTENFQRWIAEDVGGSPEDYAYYAHFDSVYVVEDEWKLVGEHANGRTEEEAIENYMNMISGKRIKHDVEPPQYIDVPKLISVR